MQNIIDKAHEIGFEEAGPLCVERLSTMQMVRDSCASDKCHAYNRNWTCPPANGTLEECSERMHRYSQGILLQTVGKLESTFDSEGYINAEKEHMKRFYEFCDYIRQEYPEALCLGAGGCRICSKCAYPEPCRFPNKAVSSMEGYGLFVTQVCRDNSMDYYHGPLTITYTACVLF